MIQSGTPEVQQLASLLSSLRDEIVITAHQHPDGDAVGSALGLLHSLRQLGKSAVVVLPDAVPPYTAWMPGVGEIRYHDTDKTYTENLIARAKLIFCLDYNSLSRTGALQQALETAQAPKVLIDHHPFPEPSFALSFSDVSACSTSQLVADLALALGGEALLSAEAANCLYTGIMTDTGSFRYPSTTAHTHRITALLIERGANNAFIHRSVYDNNTESRLRLIGYALSEKMVLLPQLGVAYFSLTREELKRFHFRKGDTEGLVNYGLSIQGIRMAAIFIEDEGKVKISFRSVGNLPVNQFSAQHFAGGGHTNAAGGRSFLSLQETLDRFLSELPEFVKQYEA